MSASIGPQPRSAAAGGLAKAATGIRGFDEVTQGGLPRGRTTLVTGGAGSGKSLFGIEFLVRGARVFGEPGVLLTFEETEVDLRANVASLGFDLAQLERDGLLAIDAMLADTTQIVTTGAFDLDGLFIRLGTAIDEVGAKRVVLDTIEILVNAFDNEAIVRAEFGRLFRWLKARGITSVVTGEQGQQGQLTRFGIEEYVSDCVIVLDHRISDDISTRRLRVAKYRGSMHGTNEYPFLITDRGFTVLPITSVGLAYEASNDLVSTGVPQLDRMLGGGVFRGSMVMVSGGAGTGKTTLAAAMVDAACTRGERALYISFEESPGQLVRNMRSVGIDLGRWLDAGLLQMWSERATAYGLESHLGRLERLLDDKTPRVVALDAIGSLGHVGSASQVSSAATREMDLIKARGITGVFTALTHEAREETSAFQLSSLIDTWLLVRNTESDGERNRLLFVIKSRGMAHSNQVREFILTNHGPELLDVCVGPGGVVTGAARANLQAGVRAAAARRNEELEALYRRSEDLKAEIAVMRRQDADESAARDRLVPRESLDDQLRASSPTSPVGSGAPGAVARPTEGEDHP